MRRRQFITMFGGAAVSLELEVGVAQETDARPRLRARCDANLRASIGRGERMLTAAQLGWLDESRAMRETLTAIKRAGADIILTYFAPDVAKLLQK